MRKKINQKNMKECGKHLLVNKRKIYKSVQNTQFEVIL